MKTKVHAFHPWLVLFAASLFFYYEFIQMNMLNAISHDVMACFNLNTTSFGKLAAFYFYATVLFLFPAGQILDRFSTRRVVLSSLSLCTIGTFLFAFASNLTMIYIARFLAGIGSAFCFLSCVRLASRWFPPQRLALLTGLIVTMAMLGGMTAQTPMTLLTEAYSWRFAVLCLAILGVIISIIIFLVVRDYPAQYQQSHYFNQQQLYQLGYWRSMRLSYLNIHNWLAGAYTCLINLPILILGGFLGNQYLHYVHHLSYPAASVISSVLFIGSTLGAPLMGWLSDQWGYRKAPMLLGAVIALVLTLAVLMLPQLHYGMLMILYLLLGFITSTQVISYPLVAESNSALLTATSVSVISISAIGGGAIFNPLFGWLIDYHAHQQGCMAPLYQASDFQFAIWLIPIAFVLGFIAALLLRETHCRRINDAKEAG